MKLTRVIAIGIILSSLGLGALNAQTLRKSSPPAEFPPASFKGNQFVDSRGCIYIRAGIDGNVTWVPRVSRNRKQVCGYKPTVVAGATSATPPKAARAPVIITANPPPKATTKPTAAPKPRQTATVKTTTPTTAPATATAAPKPATAPRATVANTQRKPSPGPAPTVISSSRPTPKADAKPVAVATTAPAPATTRRKPSPGPEPTVISSAKPKPAATPAPKATARAPGRKQRAPSPAPAATLFAAPKAAPKATTVQAANACPNASTFSRQFINKPGAPNPVRCGPQAEAPVTYASDEKHSTAAVPTAVTPVSPETRVVPRHVYDNRQNTTNVSVPTGYKTVWDDGRLNPQRAERTLRPAQVQGVVRVPAGYKLVGWGDGRLSMRRGLRTAEGDAQTNQIWTNTVPRRLIEVPTRARIVTPPAGTARAQDPQTVVSRVSTRSAPAAASSQGKRIYVRVATYATEGDARTIARSLAGSGLPMHLGRVKSSGNSVVLAGPFATRAQAKAALSQVRNAGFRNARLNK